jgi:NAD(P)-dependent dehydrogenase (short-subunit alcohol dehydrogenase family)
MNSALIECAVAIRATASDPGTAGGVTAVPVLVSCSGGPAHAEWILEKGVKPAELQKKLAAWIRQQGRIPLSIQVPDAGVFTLTRRGQHGRLADRVVVVTGSAQGFGQGIAAELAAEGAVIVVADINAPPGEAFAASLNEQHGAGTALFCRTDVTDLASLQACVAQTVAAFGGVDIFISNAGILSAGSLEEMTPETFEKVTRVNYTAYFLGAKAVAPVMKLQHQYAPALFMDIIQVNSKSGLAGSNRNFAYAGGKFGGIGLTQSFALELVADHIKVNAICPGNFFEGPLWADPEKGLFVQYLKAGKVPGARTIDDVREFYISKVPMHRGCMPKDVARAVIYLHEQEYETGQALPVTGGQVMLS